VVASLLVLKCLIYEQNSSQSNRIIVNKDCFSKSIHYILLRGVPKQDNSHINFTNLITDIIKRSSKLIQKTDEVK
jgi:hypothetical protein